MIEFLQAMEEWQKTLFIATKSNIKPYRTNAMILMKKKEQYKNTVCRNEKATAEKHAASKTI